MMVLLLLDEPEYLGEGPLGVGDTDECLIFGKRRAVDLLRDQNDARLRCLKGLNVFGVVEKRNVMLGSLIEAGGALNDHRAVAFQLAADGGGDVFRRKRDHWFSC